MLGSLAVLIHLKRTWEKLLLASPAVSAFENGADASVLLSRNAGQRAVLMFAAATGASPIAGRFSPRTFASEIQAAFREPQLPLVTYPGLTSELPYVNPPTIIVPYRLLCAMWTLPSSSSHGRSAVVSLVQEVRRGKFCACVTPSPMNTRGEVSLTPLLRRDAEETGKGDQGAAGKALTQEEFQGE